MTQHLTDTIYGQMLLPDNNDDLIRKTLELYGEWSFLEPLILSSLLENNDVAYDLGAYIGTFSLGLAGVANLKKIIAVEPSSSSGKLLEKNLQNNCKILFQIENCAVGFESGLALEQIHTNSNLGSRIYKTLDENTHLDVQLASEGPDRQRTLRQLREQYGDYNFIKLDIEGAEYDALRSDAVWIKENKPIVWAECNESPAIQKLLQFYIWAGLTPLYVAFPAFRHNPFKKTDHSPYPIAYEAALLGGSNSRLENFRTEHLGEEILITKIEDYEDLRRAIWLTPRWGHADWINLSKSELIALLGRITRGENYASFLLSDE